MADRSITVKIGANVTGFVSAMKTAAKATEDAGARTRAWISEHETAINDVSNTALGMGAALAAGAGIAISRFADFDSAMSSVQAATMETSENMELLREAAIAAGADTSFSAIEAAAAIEELAKAGLSTADILGGGLAGALDLAASDGIAVAEAAEIASAAMVQFGLSGQDVSHIADLLAAGAGKALGSVSDLGQALNQSGLVASQMGLSIEETAGSLAMFAESGLIGSDAGTSFRSMLLRLANPTKESAKLMDEMGISAYDAAGNFVGMENLAGQLQDRLGGLTQEQRNSTLATIFGQDAIRAASIAYENGAAGVREWETAVNDQGYAAEQASIRLDNLKGDLEGLGGSIETALIKGGSGANDALRGMVQWADGVVDAIGRIPGPVLSVGTAIAGLSGVGLLAAGGIGKLVIGANNALSSMQSLGMISEATGDRITGAATKAGKFALKAGGVAVGALALAKALDSIAQSGRAAELGVEGVTAALLAGDQAAIFDQYGDATRSYADAMNALVGGGINEKVNRFGNAINNSFGGTFSDSVNDARDAMTDFGSAMANLVTSGNADEAAAQVDALVASLEGEGFTRDQVMAQLGPYTEALAGQSNASELAADATDDSRSALERYAAEQDAGIETTKSYTEAIEELIDAQREAAGIVLSVRDAQRNFEEATAGVNKALEQQVEELAKQYESQGMGEKSARARAQAEVDVANKLDITTEAGRRNQAALDNVASSGWDLIDSMRANGATQGQLQQQMQVTRDRFIAAAQSMGMSADEANALADELLLIPSNVDVNVAADTSGARKSVNTLMAELQNLRATVGVSADTSAAQMAINRLRNQPRISMGVGASVGVATGGHVTGPGTGTSDSIPAWLSNGEFVVKAASVQKYGTGLLHEINAGRFANGGEVGASNPRPMLSALQPAPVVQVTSGSTLAPQVTVRIDDSEPSRRYEDRTRRAVTDALTIAGMRGY